MGGCAAHGGSKVEASRETDAGAASVPRAAVNRCTAIGTILGIVVTATRVRGLQCSNQPQPTGRSADVMLSNLDLIRRVPLFSMLTNEQAQAIADSVVKRRFAAANWWSSRGARAMRCSSCSTAARAC
jgi:hypothetical protein